MKRGIRYSLAVYTGLLFAGFLHQPVETAHSTDQPMTSLVEFAEYDSPMQPQTDTWAKPEDCRTSATATAESENEAKRHAVQTLRTMHPVRNPFR